MRAGILWNLAQLVAIILAKWDGRSGVDPENSSRCRRSNLQGQPVDFEER